MGAAAYRRASEVISKRIAIEKPKPFKAFEIMDRLNALPKIQNAPKPTEKELFAVLDNGLWWLTNPKDENKTMLFSYSSLNDLVRSWDLYLTGYNEITNVWTLTVIE